MPDAGLCHAGEPESGPSGAPAEVYIFTVHEVGCIQETDALEHLSLNQQTAGVEKVHRDEIGQILGGRSIALQATGDERARDQPVA